MTSKESYTKCKFDLRNHILESYSSSLNLTSSFLSKPNVSDACKTQTVKAIDNVILHTNKMSLQNDIINSSYLKRKSSHEDLTSVKRKLTSQNISGFYQRSYLNLPATCLAQKEHFHAATLTVNESEVKNDTTEEDNFLQRNISENFLPLTQEMPQYTFSPLAFDDVQQNEFHTAEDVLVDHINKKKAEEEFLKGTFLTLVSTSLMYSPNFRDLNSEFCQLLFSKAEEVATQYPEFILKVALYTRQELNIRTTANFLLAYAAFNVNCRSYLKQYFNTSICLPSDWLEVADICKKLSQQQESVALPSALRKVMVDAFLKFDHYQLAKYNRDPMKSKRRKQKRRDKREKEKDTTSVKINVDDQEDAVSSKQVYTLKRLIRVLHITKPTEYVMCILGKKYPEDLESFRKSKLPGNWDEEKAGKRMKLPSPETWETQLSIFGNKAAVWEKLIDKRKLPYMAMLRNIRNLLITGISKQHHKKVLKILCEEKAVVKSRQFPLRFFAAYEAIHQLESIVKKMKSGPLKYLVPTTPPIWKKKYQECLRRRANNFGVALLKEYRSAIDAAVEIACRNNVDPIQGRTLVICDALSCSISECQRFKGSIVEKMHEACLLLGMMISYAAEECELNVIQSSESWYTVDITDPSILENVLRRSIFIMVNEIDVEHQIAVDKFYNEKFSSLLERYLCPNAMHIQFDRIVLLTSGNYFDCSSGNNIMKDFVKKYRMLINKQLLYVKVDLTGKHSTTTQLPDPYDVMLFGFSDQLLRFISERGNGRQLYYIENIDKKYELKPMPKVRPLNDEKTKKLQSSIISNQLQKWETARVFISSTFKDMHGERDLIVRYIIPEIRARAKKLHVNIQEVDLRWGITEAESTSNKSLEICLSEASRCEFFLGILSERYGQVCDYIVSDDPEFQWVKEYPPGASLTELEMYCAALSNPSAAANNSFFYFRDKSFANEIPEEWKAEFFEASKSTIERLNLLKEKIKRSGLEVFENYPCSWGGVINGVPIVDHLEEFGERVLQNLWCALCKQYRKEETPLMDQMITTLHTSYSKAFQPIIGQAAFMELCISSILRDNGIFLITGNSGCGKTALMRELSKENKLQPNFPYFFGIDSRSCNIHNMLIDLTLSLYSRFELEGVPPIDYQNLVKMLPIILEMAIQSPQTSSFIIFIDGLDQVMYESEVLLDWIPCSLPKGVKMVFAVSQESSVYKKLSEKLMHYERHEFTIKPLSLPERQEIVTHHLEPYHKVLDNRPFNNQLLLLTSKRDAGYPLYLYLACEELRTFGIFEKLTLKLRNYPQTISRLLKEILTQLENFHGKNLVQMAICLLGISPEGLNENELHILLSFITCTKNCDLTFEAILAQIRNLKPESILSPIKFSSLLRTLHSIFEVSGNDLCDTLRITHGEILKSVQEYYMYQSSMKTILMLHRLLAAYFYNELMQHDSGAFPEEIPPVHIVRLLPYHLILSKEYNMLCNVLCSINYIKSALKAGIGSEILDHYLTLKELIVNNMELKTKMNNDSQKKTEDYYSFLCCNMHILQRYPQLIHQQGLNEFYNSSVYKDCTSYPEARVIRWMTKSQAQTQCYLTLSGFKQAIVSIAASPDGIRAALGAENGVVYIISISTGKLLKTFTGHSQMICSLCFIGNAQLCSASADCTLNLWDIDKGHRIHILTGHTRRVTACCSTPCERYIISVGWDCALRVWDVRNGQLLNTIKKTKHPLTCLSHHPYQELVVTGGWDTKLQIWDLVKITKKAVLKGHSASVRAVAFSPCGETIVSSSFSGEIFYWSVAQCLQIGKIADMDYPVTCLSFTKSGDFLITGSNENSLKLWSYKRGEIVQQAAIDECQIHCLTFLSLEDIAVGYKNGMCVVIEISTGYQNWRCHDIKDAITCIELCIEQSSKRRCGFVIGSSNGSILLADLEGNNHMLSIMQEVTAVVVFKENIIAGTNNGEMFLIPFSNFEPHCIPAHQSAITKFLVKQDQLITISKDHSLKMWYLSEDCDLVQKISLPHCHGDWITACMYTDSILVTGSQDCTLKVWDIESLENKAVLSELKSPINHVALEGNYIVAGTRDGEVGVWSKQGNFITSIPPIENCGFTHVSHITKSVSSEDKETVYQHLLAIADENNHLILRKPFSKMLLATIPCHASPVSSFCVTSEDRLLSCSFDDKVEFWKLKSPEQYDRHAAIHHKAAVTSVGISPNGKFGFSTDAGGRLVVWTINLSDKENSLYYKLKKEWECASIPSAIFIQSGGQLLIVCALTKLKDKYCKENFAELLKLDQGMNIKLKESGSCTFTDEVLSMDSNVNNVAFGLKSGMVVITNKFLKIQKIIKVSCDWIIGTMFSADISANIYATVSSGILKLGSCTSENPIIETWKDFGDDITWPTAYGVIDDKFCLGTNDGFLHIFFKEGSNMHKIHSGSVKDISVCCDFIFTCSEDNLIRVWESSSMKQVGQFYFPLPVTVLETQIVPSAIKSNKTIAIICGTKIGEVHLLTWTS